MGDVINDYQPIMNSKKVLQLKEKRGLDDTCREAVIIWTATGLSVIAMSVAEKWGRVFRIGFHV